jgi:hypothetical protein
MPAATISNLRLDNFPGITAFTVTKDKEECGTFYECTTLDPRMTMELEVKYSVIAIF